MTEERVIESRTPFTIKGFETRTIYGCKTATEAKRKLLKAVEEGSLPDPNDSTQDMQVLDQEQTEKVNWEGTKV